MNKKTLIFLFAMIIAMALPSCKGDDKVKDEKAVDPWTEQMNHNLADLATRLEHQPYTTSMSIYNLSADSFLFNYHERQQMIPASTLKLLIAISALENLGIKGEFHTTLHQNGSISGGTLHGDLILVGGFDPLLSLGDLQAMARAVKNAGIQRVDGRLIGDVSMTDTLRMGNGWSWDDYPSPVTPYLTPLFFDHQRLRTKNWNMIANPDKHCLRTFASELQKAGVSVDGERLLLSTSGVNPRGKELSRISHSLSQVLPTMLKDSDNLYAEALFYRLASLKKNKGATVQDGLSMVKNTLTRAGCDNFNFRIVDGSGLSPYDNMTAESQIRLLIYAYNNKMLLFSPLYSSLAVAGKSGTLAARMTEGKATSRVHAKTGTSANACCLTGYAKASNGDDLAFAILSNGVLNPNRCRAFQDDICQLLCE
ncbi:MAG: D-alanyl-D-alanine carboxypeptidase/D-alanyl-D-alanine-endopeptidase [Bacteroidaceae bacterium]|nr:D-alanyl-D-alanine carboxypeptidase/D-alanyl-D-alanine-endopeptidase [Bacteroidaceae bacterium]